MSTNGRAGRLVPALLLAASLAAAGPARAGTIDPALARAIEGLSPGQTVQVIVSLSDRLPLQGYGPGASGLRGRPEGLLRALRARAADTQEPVEATIRAGGGRSVVSLWATNSLAATVPSRLVRALAAHPGVESVRLDATVTAPAASAPAASAELPAGWNVQVVKAPDLWALGTTGAGAVVASLDTGVDADHPDLGPRWRGGANSWFDPNGQHATPYDASGHGTQTMGLMVGGSAGGTAIGVAPGATWIAAKVFDDSGRALLSRIHLAFQWLLDPDGDPATDDAPDVVNSSWSLTSTGGVCSTEFATDIAVLRASGIAAVFSAGNSGSAPGSNGSPANNAGALAVGAVGQDGSVAPFSARGPNVCDGSVFPGLVAPGVSVTSADLTFGGVFPGSYAVVTGTSFSAPHVAGGLALLWSAHPSATLAAVEGALEGTARDLGAAGPDNDSGNGLADLAAANAALDAQPAPPVANGDAYAATVGSTLAVAAPGVLANDTSPSGASLTALLGASPAAGTLSLAPDGSFTFVPPAAAGTQTFTYSATDGTSTSSAAVVTIAVTGPAQPPVAAGDSYGAIAGVPLTVAAPGVLANDSSPSGAPLSARLGTGPAKGTLTLSADGSFQYQANGTAATTDSFTYTASDGSLTSPAATVTLTVAANAPPVAANDSASTKKGTAVTIKVLANDQDPEGALAPATVAIVAAPSKGTAVKKANGTVVYTPSRGFSGTDSFRYTVKDAAGLVSNAAAVTVTVR